MDVNTAKIEALVRELLIERLTEQISHAVMDSVDASGVGVMIECRSMAGSGLVATLR